MSSYYTNPQQAYRPVSRLTVPPYRTYYRYPYPAAQPAKKTRVSSYLNGWGGALASVAFGCIMFILGRASMPSPAKAVEEQAKKLVTEVKPEIPVSSKLPNPFRTESGTPPQVLPEGVHTTESVPVLESRTIHQPTEALHTPPREDVLPPTVTTDSLVEPPKPPASTTVEPSLHPEPAHSEPKVPAETPSSQPGSISPALSPVEKTAEEAELETLFQEQVEGKTLTNPARLAELKTRLPDYHTVLEKRYDLIRIKQARADLAEGKTLPADLIQKGYANEGVLKNGSPLRICDARLDLDEYNALLRLSELKKEGKVSANNLKALYEAAGIKGNKAYIKELVGKLTQYYETLSSCWRFTENKEVRNALLTELETWKQSLVQ